MKEKKIVYGNCYHEWLWKINTYPHEPGKTHIKMFSWIISGITDRGKIVERAGLHRGMVRSLGHIMFRMPIKYTSSCLDFKTEVRSVIGIWKLSVYRWNLKPRDFMRSQREWVLTEEKPGARTGSSDIPTSRVRKMTKTSQTRRGRRAS